MSKEKLVLANIFFKQAKLIDGMSVVHTPNGTVMIPPKTKYYYMPRIIIKDLERFESALEDYMFAVQTTDIKSTFMDERHDVEYFLGNLTKNITNHDCNNFEEYVEICTAFITDDSFSKYDQKTDLGNLSNENHLLIKRSQEYYGPETPYVLKMMIKNKHIEYELPLIRYGIYKDEYDNKVARIYMIQRKKQYNDSPAVNAINKSFSVVNSGVKEERNVPPSMLIVLSTFLGLLQSEGINKILVPDFMNRRYAHFQNARTEEERNKIQYHATNIFLKLFLRITQHFEGIDITAYPNDIDSFMHISLTDELKCNSELLKQCYILGRSAQTINFFQK